MLFLRPTESATVFLQQLGRGLRRTRDKAVLTVLDFVGYHRKEFRFDQKLARADRCTPDAGSSARSKRASRSSRRAARSCWIEQAQTLVLENIRSQIANRWQQIVASCGPTAISDLGDFLDESGVEL